MKYLKKYNLFESVVKVREYYINGKNWDYQLGYIWSPAVLVGSHGRNDSDVNSVEIEDDGMSNTLANRTVFHLFKEHLGTSNLKDLCEFHLLNLGYAYQPKDEFAFLEEGLLEKRYYVNIRVPGKTDIISQVPNFDGDYLDIVGDLTGHKFTDKERNDIEKGKDNKYYGGSWHINVCLYDVDGIKMISTDMDGIKCYILKRDEIERLLDMTKSYNYYRFEDKDKQLLRLGDKFLEYSDIKDIFLELSDIDNKIIMKDFNQISKDKIMLKFITTDMSFNKELVDILKNSISRFTNSYGLEFDSVDLTLNSMMYMKDNSDTWMMKDRPVDSYKDLDKLMDIGEMQYGLHTRGHAMYIIFNII